MRVGAVYSPEQWPAERWLIDARMMQEAGLRLVRMGTYSWPRLEPAESQFDFTWLDQAIELFASHGITCWLCTPTAAPPAWVVEQSSFWISWRPRSRRRPDMIPASTTGRWRANSAVRSMSGWTCPPTSCSEPC
jgi:beta-galactosidase GanA